MTAPVVRHLRLSATQGSPAAARAAVGEVVLAAGLGAVLDEALLLATELVTNSVVHVGADLEVEIVATSDAITVTVLDQQRAPLVFRGWEPASTEPMLVADQLAERGRGLLLVDRFADCWGTIHHQGGKGVWFRLEKPRGPQRSQVTAEHDPGQQAAAIAKATAVPLTEGPFAGFPTPQAVAALGSVFSAATGRTGLAEIGTELLRRLCDVTGAESATLVVDEADGKGARAIAGYNGATSGREVTGRGRQLGNGQPGSLRTRLRLSRPWRGELMLAAPNPAYASPLAELTAERLTLLIENHRLRRTGAARRAWLTFLAEASELLAQSLDVDLTLALIPRLVVPRLGDWCAIHSVNGDGELALAAAAHADESKRARLLATLNTAIAGLGEALQTDGPIRLAAPIDGYTVALVARGQRLGTLTVGPGSQSWSGTEEVAIVEDLARRAALAIDNAKIHADRRDVAHTLQRSLLPPTLPNVPGVEFAAEYVPTGEGTDVGGDFYDVVALGERRWLVVVGDVSGKGVHAATLTGLVRDVTRVLVRDGRTLPEVLTRLNETLVERGGGRFCTLALATITAAVDGLITIDLHLAGHDQPLLVLPDGRASFVGRCGTALGLLTTVSSPVTRVTLAPGDTLIFYTDGVTERRGSEELFGQDRLKKHAAALAGYPASAVAARLRAATLQFSSSPPRDDIAIFVLRNDHSAS